MGVCYSNKWKFWHLRKILLKLSMVINNLKAINNNLKSIMSSKI